MGFMGSLLSHFWRSGKWRLQKKNPEEVTIPHLINPSAKVLMRFALKLCLKLQHKGARNGLWVASPYAAIYLCHNKRIVFLSSSLPQQWAAFEAGTDDSPQEGHQLPA